MEIFSLDSVIVFYEIERFVFPETFKGAGLGLCSQCVGSIDVVWWLIKKKKKYPAYNPLMFFEREVMIVAIFIWTSWTKA